MRRRRSALGNALGPAALWVLLSSAPALATFHVAHISEVMTSYGGSADVQFVEITMDAPGQTFVTGTKLNVFNAAGGFVATALTVPSDVESGATRPWLMGTSAFETASGVTPDFTFTNGALPVEGGMICWGDPGQNATPVSCPLSGAPYVDCIAYGSYAGPTNGCIGTPTPLVPAGHSLQRLSATRDNAADFACADPATPENNARDEGAMPATVPCSATTSTLPATTTTVSGPTTTLPSTGCGDANGDSSITASDALIALRTAVGSAACAPSVCDVDANGAISASDALRILKAAVGAPVDLTCAA